MTATLYRLAELLCTPLRDVCPIMFGAVSRRRASERSPPMLFNAPSPEDNGFLGILGTRWYTSTLYRSEGFTSTHSPLRFIQNLPPCIPQHYPALQKTLLYCNSSRTPSQSYQSEIFDLSRSHQSNISAQFLGHSIFFDHRKVQASLHHGTNATWHLCLVQRLRL
jgi:hypothetical protein